MKFDVTKLFATATLGSVCLLATPGCSAKTDTETKEAVEEIKKAGKETGDAVKAAAEEAAMDRLLDALTGKGSSEATRASFRQRFSDGSLDTAEVEVEVSEAPAMPRRSHTSRDLVRKVSFSAAGLRRRDSRTLSERHRPAQALR